MALFTLSEIWIYPIKSLGGIRLASAKVLPKGLLYDRRWMSKSIYQKSKRLEYHDKHYKLMTANTFQTLHQRNNYLKTSITPSTTYYHRL